MTLLATERIKLFSTRSMWWCAFLAVGMNLAYAVLLVSQADGPVEVPDTQRGTMFAMMVVQVLAALSVTTEHRFGTISTTYQAVPNRVAVLLAKTTVVAAVAFVIGELASFASLGAGVVLSPGSPLAIDSDADLRSTAGTGLVFALAAVLAVAVGSLVRHTAGAVTLLLLWPLLAEPLVAAVPQIGMQVYRWMPFVMANHFLDAPRSLSGMPFGPWASLVYFAAVAFGALAIAAVVGQRRDAR
ncbi:ABC transporter permease [Saccharopolyspora rectivirgula]|jgi:ABC-2 type transport system permease protein|uniref:Membrane protein n=1 Tax=Saccharopolyspora rectivirgula TaxID=28042 RepID=A0A073B1V8_9PSEU|nr:ABC transporter permease [Saccharopolyspora rectivirgula]KEI45988.1 membrane protein [Saccharopolyspora rectivirgula]